jgi:FHS family glucose/mannose:H+ symporter-like MFS transporter
MFALTGVVTTLLGPALPILQARWHLNDAEAGSLFMLQFVGAMLGSAVSGLAIAKAGFRTTLTIGVGLVAAGVGILSVSGWIAGMGAVFCYGLGLGLAIPATNLLVADRFPESRAAALSLLNLSWGCGAVAAPPVVASLHRLYGAGGAQLFLIVIAAALFTCASLVRLIAPASCRVRDDDARHGGSWTGGALLFGVFFFLYVGTETALSGWIAVYAQRISALSPAVSIALPSLFWGMLLIGRALAPWTLRTWSTSQMLGICLSLATAGVTAVLLASSGISLAVSIAIAGLGLSAIFPITMARFSEDLDRDATRAAGPVFVLAALGGATLPWLVGFVSAQTSSLWSGLIVPLVGCLGMFALFYERLRREPRIAAREM